MKRKHIFSIFMICMTVMMTSIFAEAYGPAVMYNPSENTDAVIPGAMSPRTIQLSHNGENNEKMYSTFQCNTSTEQTFPVYESTDNGANWTKVGEVRDTQNSIGMNCCPQLFEMPQTIGSLTEGTIICAGISSPSDNSIQYLELYKSNDLGRTWTYVSRITSAPNAGAGDPIWEPFLMVANDKLICYYSDERDPSHSQILVHQTTVDGIEWSPVVVDSAMTDGNLRPGMPVVAKMSNGNYIMTYEVANIKGTPSNYKISSDPESWDVTAYGTTFAYGGSPFCATLQDGRIAISSYDGSGCIYINTENDLSGRWAKYPTPISSGYNREIVPLANGRIFFTSCIGFFESGMHPVSYADMETPPCPSTYVKIQNCSTGLYIDGYGSTGEGADCKQYSGNSSYNQQWALVSYEGNYLLQNRGTGLYLDGYGREITGSVVAQYLLSYHANQQWSLEESGNYYKIKNVGTGLYLDGMGYLSDGDGLYQCDNNSDDDQLWSITEQ